MGSGETGLAANKPTTLCRAMRSMKIMSRLADKRIQSHGADLNLEEDDTMIENKSIGYIVGGGLKENFRVRLTVPSPGDAGRRICDHRKR